MDKQNAIPEQMKKMATSPAIYEKTERIGNKFGLHIDQLGELDAEITDIFLGKIPSQKFVPDIIERLEISKELADQITNEVNKEIFAAIKSGLQSQESSGISDLEHIGGFSIDKEELEKEATSLKVPEKAKILSSVEDRPPVDPMIDHLLTTPNSQVEEKIVQKAQEPLEHHAEPPIPANLPTEEAPASEMAASQKTQQAQAPVPPKTAPSRPPGSDPYRETFN